MNCLIRATVARASSVRSSGGPCSWPTARSTSRDGGAAAVARRPAAAAAAGSSGSTAAGR